MASAVVARISWRFLGSSQTVWSRPTCFSRPGGDDAHDDGVAIGVVEIGGREGVFGVELAVLEEGLGDVEHGADLGLFELGAEVVGGDFFEGFLRLGEGVDVVGALGCECDDFAIGGASFIAALGGDWAEDNAVGLAGDAELADPGEDGGGEGEGDAGAGGGEVLFAEAVGDAVGRVEEFAGDDEVGPEHLCGFRLAGEEAGDLAEAFGAEVEVVFAGDEGVVVGVEEELGDCVAFDDGVGGGLGFDDVGELFGVCIAQNDPAVGLMIEQFVLADGPGAFGGVDDGGAGAVVEGKVIAGAEEEGVGGGGAGLFEKGLESLAEAGFGGDAFAVVVLDAVDEFAGVELFFGAGAGVADEIAGVDNAEIGGRERGREE